MPYQHLTDSCFSDTIGGAGLTRASFDKTLAETADALETLRARHRDASLPLLRLPHETGDMKALRGVARVLRKRFDDVVVLGTGGSSLAGQTLCALADRGYGPPAGSPRLHFRDNVDPDTFAAMFESVDPARTGILAISKSGGTAETLMQLVVCLDFLRGSLGDDGIATHAIAITEAGDNPLRRLAARFGMKTLDHDPLVGGRYSALSLVGLLPALTVGLDAAKIRAGAAEVLDPLLAGAAPEDLPPAVGAAISVALLRDNGIAQTVLMPYIDRLADFGLWYRQLWAESLGKAGAGTTPIRAMGTVDQHSQLQLYLDGPADKMFTLVGLDCRGTGPRAASDLTGDDALAYLSGRTMGDLLAAEERATAETLARHGRPTRSIRLASLDERVMGALMMHFMVETIIAAHLLGVDPFDQPAVEAGKILTRQYLDESAGAT